VHYNFITWQIYIFYVPLCATYFMTSFIWDIR